MEKQKRVSNGDALLFVLLPGGRKSLLRGCVMGLLVVDRYQSLKRHLGRFGKCCINNSTLVWPQGTWLGWGCLGTPWISGYWRDRDVRALPRESTRPIGALSQTLLSFDARRDDSKAPPAVLSYARLLHYSERRYRSAAQTVAFAAATASLV
jgi:hypothetical protein